MNMNSVDFFAYICPCKKENQTIPYCQVSPPSPYPLLFSLLPVCLRFASSYLAKLERKKDISGLDYLDFRN